MCCGAGAGFQKTGTTCTPCEVDAVPQHATLLNLPGCLPPYCPTHSDGTELVRVRCGTEGEHTEGLLWY